ncbi:MAG: hypothetical protein LUE29_02495 [Lachnospiraceae bacterium]|nr:hypothetical protein [Lachnospiraceae bacterium]
MGNCLSRQYETPFHIEQTGYNIYSIEELAYYLYHYTAMIDRDFFTEELAAYVEQVLGKRMVAQRMRELMHQKDSVADLILLLVKSADYFDEIELVSLQKKLDERKGESELEKARDRVKALEQLEKYIQAAECCSDILEHAPKHEATPEFLAEMTGELGSIYGKMLKFHAAEAAFRKSMSIYPTPEVRKKMVYLLLIQGRDAEILDFREEFGLTEPVVRECERQFQKTRKIYRETKPSEPPGVEKLKAEYRKENGYH